uniref:Uncharacterized protein n=1 Tax=Arundo donax TaxID=35708 RepID=A0A0A9BUH9_ARUDO
MNKMGNTLFQKTEKSILCFP